jgi:hypothetical protein
MTPRRHARRARGSAAGSAQAVQRVVDQSALARGVDTGPPRRALARHVAAEMAVDFQARAARPLGGSGSARERGAGLGRGRGCAGRGGRRRGCVRRRGTAAGGAPKGRSASVGPGARVIGSTIPGGTRGVAIDFRGREQAVSSSSRAYGHGREVEVVPGSARRALIGGPHFAGRAPAGAGPAVHGRGLAAGSKAVEEGHETTGIPALGMMDGHDAHGVQDWAGAPSRRGRRSRSQERRQEWCPSAR